MALVLGIDVGGAYTDAVLFDNGSDSVVKKAKVPVMRQDAKENIFHLMDVLDFDRYSDIAQVHLTSTLATNYIIENKLKTTGLIIAGKHIQDKLPVKMRYELIKAVDDKGKFILDSCPSKVQEILKRIKDAEVLDTIAISAFGANGAEYEKKIKSLLQGISDVEILCVSEMDSQFDFYDRTLAAMTKIGIKSALTELLRLIQEALETKGILAPLYFIKGDGELATIEEVIADPMVAMCSGQASSAMGGRWLTSENDYLFVDIGGSSVNMAKIENRNLNIAKRSVKIGKYAYSLKSLALQSFGLGGDSEIKLNCCGDIEVGPQRVIPLCTIGREYPNLTEELIKFPIPKTYDLCTARETDCYIFNENKRIAYGGNLSSKEEEILHIIRDEPHSLFYIADMLGTDADALRMDILCAEGYVHCASLTPTDILHFDNRLNTWDRAIAAAGVQVMAGRKGWTPQRFAREVNHIITDKMVLFCMESIVKSEDQSYDIGQSEAARYLMEKYLGKSHGILTANFHMTKAIVAVGALAAAFMQTVAQKLNTRLIVFDDGDVAGAMGAAIGKVWRNGLGKLE